MEYCLQQGLIRSLRFCRHAQLRNGYGTLQVRGKSSTTTGTSETEVDDKPVKFTGSKAAEVPARFLYSGIREERPWFQPYVVCASMAIFLIYFGVLREESDIDLEFDKTLYDRIPGLEKKGKLYRNDMEMVGKRW